MENHPLHILSFLPWRARHREKCPAVSDTEDFRHVGPPLLSQFGQNSLITPDVLLYEVEPGMTGLEY